MDIRNDIAHSIMCLMDSPNGITDKINNTLNNPLSTEVDLASAATVCLYVIQLAISDPNYIINLPIYVKAFNRIISDTRYTNERKTIEKVRTLLNTYHF